VTGRSDSVSLLTCAHACSQACSQGQGYRHQGVMYCCEVCEAKFLLFLEINKYIGRCTHRLYGWAGVRTGILASHCSQTYRRVLRRGVGARVGRGEVCE
jgi:hypothetical protein